MPRRSRFARRNKSRQAACRRTSTGWMQARRLKVSSQTALLLVQLPIAERRGTAGLLGNPESARPPSGEPSYRGRMRDAFASLGAKVSTLEAGPFGVLAAIRRVAHDTVAATTLFERSVAVAERRHALVGGASRYGVVVRCRREGWWRPAPRER
jgi:hypothetical protein